MSKRKWHVVIFKQGMNFYAIRQWLDDNVNPDEWDIDDESLAGLYIKNDEDMVAFKLRFDL